MKYGHREPLVRWDYAITNRRILFGARETRIQAPVWLVALKMYMMVVTKSLTIQSTCTLKSVLHHYALVWNRGQGRSASVPWSSGESHEGCRNCRACRLKCSGCQPFRAEKEIGQGLAG